MATVQGNFVQIQQPNLHGPLPLLLWKTTIVVPTGQTGVQVQPSNKVSGRVIECRIDPVTLAAGATIKGFATSDGFAAKNYFMDYTVPNPAVETKDALYQRLLVHGTIQIDVASAVAGNSFVLYVYVHPSADVLTVQGDADGTPVPVSEPDTAAASAGEAVNISAADHICSATTRALYVGGGGDVIATVGGVDLTFKDVPGGTILPIAATAIKDESTATYMVALW